MIDQNNCSVIYYNGFCGCDDGLVLFNQLLTECKWTPEGKRKTAFYGDRPYTYGSIHQDSKSVPAGLAVALMEKVNSHFKSSCNTVLANLYENGQNFIPWHSDDEKSLGKQPTIISLSLGGQRLFAFKNKRTGKCVEIQLEHGSVIVMNGKTQEEWLHSVPRQTTSNARINLTFRKIVV